jgi:hypothetical protein
VLFVPKSLPEAGFGTRPTGHRRHRFTGSHVADASWTTATTRWVWAPMHTAARLVQLASSRLRGRSGASTMPQRIAAMPIWTGRVAYREVASC